MPGKNSLQPVNRRTHLQIALLVLIVGILALAVLVSVSQAQSVRNLPQAKITGGGPEACLACHGGAKMTLMEETVHGDMSNPHSPYAQSGCESCHGPGSFHVSSARGGVGFPPLNDFKHVGSLIEGQFDTCLSCHAKTSGNRLGIGWEGSAHEDNGLTCSSCHEVHAVENPLLNVTEQQNLCASCHGMTNSKHEGFEQNGIRLERLACSTCHNPHD